MVSTTAGTTRTNLASTALGEIAYQRLRDAIRQGVFRPGDPVRERRVSEWLNISRTPVRDALRRLQNEGYLVHKLHSGVVVASLDRKGITELYALRGILEGAAAAAAARHATAAQVAAMRRIVAAAGRTRDAAQIARCNYEFHTLIHQAADNQYLRKTLDSVRETLVLVGRSTMVLAERPAQVQAEHRRILDCIARRDAAGAGKAMQRHLQLALTNRFRLQDEESAADFPDVSYPLAATGPAPVRASTGRTRGTAAGK